MKKLIPVTVLAVMLLLLTMSWINVAKYKNELNAEYNRHIENAESYVSKKVYIDAVKEYERALEYHPEEFDIAMEIAELYQKLDNNGAFVKACENAISIDPKQPKPYLLLVERYLSKMNYSKAFATLQKAEAYIPDNKDIIKKIKELKGKYSTLSTKFDTFSGFQYEGTSKDGYARVSLDGKYGLLKTNNKMTIPFDYEDIGLFMNKLIPVKQGGEWFYITKDGYRKLVPDHPAEELGAFSSKYAPAKIDGVYGYIDMKAKEYHFEYEYAGCFANDIAAVKKDGKWGIINISFEKVTDFKFDDIVMDEYGFCSENGVFIAVEDGKYYIYDTNGEKLSDGYDEIRRFVSKEPAAFRKGDKWGFISKSGEVIMDATYEDADSFNLGYAPFCKKGKWGCIDENSNVVIEPDFEEMSVFSRNGKSLVTQDGIKQFLVVKIYE